MGMQLPTDKRLDDIFDTSGEIEDLPVAHEEAQVPAVKTAVEHDPDVEEAIELLKRTAITGEDLFNTIADIATRSENARNYEVAATLMRSVTDIAKTIIEEKRKKAMLEDPPADKVTNNNTLIVQSTEDVLKNIYKKIQNG